MPAPAKLTRFSHRNGAAGTGARSAEMRGVIPQNTQPNPSPTEMSAKYGALNSCGAATAQLMKAYHDSQAGRPDCQRIGLRKTSTFARADGRKTASMTTAVATVMRR